MPTGPDQVYETYPFRSSTTDMSRALRTPLERINDEVDVREFGPVDTPTHIRQTIQKALDSGLNIFFSQGIYDIDSPIEIPNDTHRRTIRGAGSSKFFGTSIRGNFRDYLWKSQQAYSGDESISSISGMAFLNTFTFGGSEPPITQVDPPDTSGTGGGAFAGNGMGCLFLNLGFIRITNVVFDLSAGVALYCPGINNYVSSFFIDCSFGGVAAAPFTCGIWGAGRVGNGKVHDCRYGIVAIQGPSSLSDMDIERCQWGIITTNPIDFWDRNTNDIMDAMGEPGGKVNITGINFESCGSISQGGGTMYLKGATLDVSGIDIAATGQHSDPVNPATPRMIGDYHILIDGAGGSLKNITGGGILNVSGIAVKPGAENYDCIFQHCSPGVPSTSGLPGWDVLSSPNDANNRQKHMQGRNGHKFIGCNTHIDNDYYVAVNGACPFNRLPFPDPSVFDEQIINDCLLPEIDYSTTPPTVNRGETVLAGGGSNLTRVVHRPIANLAALANWTTASGTLSVTANPTGYDGGGTDGKRVQPGMMIWNATTGRYVGQVADFTGTAVLLARDPNDWGLNQSTAFTAGSIGNILTFSAWTVV